MGNKEHILELFRREEREFTVGDVAFITKFNKNEARVYIHRLKNENLLKETGKRGRYITYKAVDQEEREKIEIYEDIIKRFIPKFIEKGIDIDFPNEEFKIVKKLYEEVK
jgi:DNA-binding transcriptional regulator YhcF (GntR family)